MSGTVDVIHPKRNTDWQGVLDYIIDHGQKAETVWVDLTRSRAVRAPTSSVFKQIKFRPSELKRVVFLVRR